MQVCAVLYNASTYTDELYNGALACVDAESQTRIKRFYHRADSCRTLIGRLLIRKVLQERGMPSDKMIFAVTPEGKPYIVEQTANPPLAYNITHDNNLIAMSFGPGYQKPPAFSIGIDVMKVKPPHRESLNSFIETVGEQLTDHEHTLLKEEEDVTEYERLKRFYWMWTLKEAYTKALGLGLGFDFRRVEFDPVQRHVRVDGNPPVGWRFRMFTVQDQEDHYEGVVAEYLGGTSMEIFDETVAHDWLKIYDAVSFTKNAIAVLKT